jgi:fido (protein-threonine AMPylation protein)
MEGAARVRQARQAFQEITTAGLIALHSNLFEGRRTAGELRRTVLKPRFRGQDCPDPEFIPRSLDNLVQWLSAESVTEIHPIERTALILSRIVDIWPFEFGNLTVGIIAGNLALRQAGFTPFFVMPDAMKEFHNVVGQAMSIEMQPLVNAIYRTIKREMEALASG